MFVLLDGDFSDWLGWVGLGVCLFGRRVGWLIVGRSIFCFAWYLVGVCLFDWLVCKLIVIFGFRLISVTLCVCMYTQGPQMTTNARVAQLAQAAEDSNTRHPLEVSSIMTSIIIRYIISRCYYYDYWLLWCWWLLQLLLYCYYYYHDDDGCCYYCYRFWLVWL